MAKSKAGTTEVVDCLRNIKEAADEIALWPEWKVRNIRLAFSEPAINLNSEKPAASLADFQPEASL